MSGRQDRAPRPGTPPTTPATRPVVELRMLAIRAARLFDGLAVTERVLVLVEGGAVVDVDATGAAPPPEAELVDLGAVTLLPGLLDAHVHLALDASPTPVAHLDAADDEVLFDRMGAAAQRALAAGSTTVRDLGDRAYLGRAAPRPCPRRPTGRGGRRTGQSAGHAAAGALLVPGR